MTVIVDSIFVLPEDSHISKVLFSPYGQGTRLPAFLTYFGVSILCINHITICNVVGATPIRIIRVVVVDVASVVDIPNLLLFIDPRHGRVVISATSHISLLLDYSVSSDCCITIWYGFYSLSRCRCI